jgi:hypothetical protein
MIVVAAELMTVVVPVLRTVGAVHLRQQGLHLWLLVARLELEMGLWILLLRAWYSLLVLKLKRMLDGERCSELVNDLCLHCHREQE